MTILELEEAIQSAIKYQKVNDLGFPSPIDRDAVLNAAKSYAALLKLAPEIGALVEAGEKCTKFALDTAKSFDEGESCECPLCDGEGVVETDTYMNMDGVALNVQFSGVGDEFTSWHKFVEIAANTRPTLKAIHDNLTKWGE